MTVADLKIVCEDCIILGVFLFKVEKETSTEHTFWRLIYLVNRWHRPLENAHKSALYPILKSAKTSPTVAIGMSYGLLLDLLTPGL